MPIENFRDGGEIYTVLMTRKPLLSIMAKGLICGLRMVLNFGSQKSCILSIQITHIPYPFGEPIC